MYLLLLLVVLVICLAISASPIFAVLLAVAFLIGLGAYKFLGSRTEPEHAPPPNQAADQPSGAAATTETSDEEKQKAGPWGETWPEQRQSEEPST